jgi:hypothetical protein
VVRKRETNINEFFQHRREVFYNYQDLDFVGLKGRLLSVSYIPLKEDPNYERMLKDLKTVFKKYEHGGKIRIEYDTEIHYGQLD